MLVLSPCQPYAHYIHRSLSLAAMRLLSVFHDDCMTGSTRCKAEIARYVQVNVDAAAKWTPSSKSNCSPGLPLS